MKTKTPIISDYPFASLRATEEWHLELKCTFLLRHRYKHMSPFYHIPGIHHNPSSTTSDEGITVPPSDDLEGPDNSDTEDIRAHESDLELNPIDQLTTLLHACAKVDTLGCVRLYSYLHRYFANPTISQ